jgi:AmpD protein
MRLALSHMLLAGHPMQQSDPRAPFFEVDAASGELRGVRQIASPNCDARPMGVLPSLIVVHGISLPPGEFGGPWIERLFTGALPPDAHPYFADMASLRVSAHLVVSRDGSVTQYVKFRDRAWHAGQSRFEGREACNDFSIGVELEGTDSVPYEAAQYLTLAGVVAALCRAYPGLSPQRLVGHSDIAPGRKTDPGPAFEWPLAQRLIERAVASS